MRKPWLSLALLLSCATTHPGPTRLETQVDSDRPAEPTRKWTQPRSVVIRHATVLPASGPRIDDGAIAFANGLIVAVGRSAEVATPEGAEELDGTGQFVTPGIIDAHSHLGVYARPESFSNDDGNELTAPVTAEVNAMHSYWPQDPGLRRAAAGGITSLLILPGSGNLIGGRGFPVKLHFGRTASEVRFPSAKDVLKMACGENPKRVYGQGQHRAPSTRMGNVAGFRQAFSQAKEYAAKLEEWRKKPADKAGLAPTRDLKLETLAGVLRGEILVENHCYRADEMQVMMEIAAEFGFHIRAFHHAVDAYKVRDLLAKNDVAVATWADWWGAKLEMWDSVPENAALITEQGGRVAIHSDSESGIQRLNQEAAKALTAARAAGIAISEEQALRWITLNPAWIMGTEAVTGSLEAGKMADLVLWDKHPFSVYARAQRVWADGVVTFDAKTGPAVPSDFEVGEAAQTWARLIPHPAPAPRLPSAEPARLPLTPGECVAVQAQAVILGEKHEPGTVVLRDGKIAVVLPGEAAPAGCSIVRGAVLSAGFIDPWSSLGLSEVQAESASNDSAAGTGKELPVHAAARAQDSVNPASALFPVARMGGLTAAVTSLSGGLVSGQSALVGTDGAVLRGALALNLHLGEEGKEIAGTHGLALELVRELFDDAREYGKRRADFDQNKMRKVSASRLDLEALLPVLAGKMPLVISADRTTDLRAALALAADYHLRIILKGAAEGWRVAAEIAAARVPVIVQPTTDNPDSFDSLASRADNAALLAAKGVRVLIAPFRRPHEVRTLPQEAGNAVAWGLPWDEAMRAVTSNVAEVFGLDSGVLREGARGDLVLWSGDPLEVTTLPVAIWIAGKQTTLESRQTALFEKYRKVP